MEPIIKEIKRHVKATDMDEAAEKGYQIGINDILALCEAADRVICGAICYTFLFGKAMAYRAAREGQRSTP